MTGEQHIVVLGAGYGGLAAARGLARTAKNARITVVDARAEFVERVRLHQAAAGQDISRWDLGEALRRRNIEFVQARVTELDLTGNRVLFGDGAALEFDTLVYALGSIGGHGGVPGAAEYALSVATPEEVRRPVGPVVVVGAGATGIELAAELAESQPDSPVTLLSAEEPGHWLSRRAGAYVRTVLERLGVDVRSGVKVVEVLPDGVRLADGTVVNARTIIWTAGFAVPDLAARAGLEVDGAGRVRTDATLRSVSHPRVYAVGDAAAVAGPGGRELRMACATALPTGAYAAKAIGARLRGREPREFRFRYTAQCLSLGRRHGVIQAVWADDSPGPVVVRGRMGAVLKEQVVRFALRSAKP